MQQNNVKSATTAGLLGIFLGVFGVHNWYLGEKNKGIIHVCLVAGGILIEIIAGAILPNALSYTMLFQLAWLLSILSGIGAIAISASGIWGLVEGITILAQGDAGLARKGFAVAPMGQNYNQGYGFPQNYGPQNYQQPMNNYGPQNYQQPMNNPMNSYGPQSNQPMNNYDPQPYSNQPMDNNPYNSNMNQGMDNMNQMSDNANSGSYNNKPSFNDFDKKEGSNE